jgi:hypothetical protein
VFILEVELHGYNKVVPVIEVIPEVEATIVLGFGFK